MPASPRPGILLIGSLQHIQQEYDGMDIPACTERNIRISHKALAHRARAFALKIIYHNRSRLAQEKEGSATYVTFDELLQSSDILSLNLPATPNTRHTILRPQFEMMKDCVVVINTARVSLIEEAALVDALENGKVLSAGLDVYEDESRVHPGLISNYRVMLLPQHWYGDYETKRETELLVLRNLEHALDNGEFLTPFGSNHEMKLAYFGPGLTESLIGYFVDYSGSNGEVKAQIGSMMLMLMFVNRVWYGKRAIDEVFIMWHKSCAVNRYLGFSATKISNMAWLGYSWLEHTNHSYSLRGFKEPQLHYTMSSSIEKTTELEFVRGKGPDVFTTPRSPWTFTGARGVYGGTTAAQCLVAAQHTVSSEHLVVYSMHIGFLQSSKVNISIEYHVDRTRDSKNFATRIVRALQEGRIIATATVSFASAVGATGREDGGAPYEHAKKIPAGLSPPDHAELETYKVDGPLEIRKGKILSKYFDNSADTMIRYWMRAKGPIQKNRVQSHLAALTFLTDAYLLGVAAEVQDDAKYEDLGVVASLNHTVHFHEPNAVRADQWMCSERESPWAGRDRALAVHRIWSSDGVLLTTCVQEVGDLCGHYEEEMWRDPPFVFLHLGANTVGLA